MVEGIVAIVTGGGPGLGRSMALGLVHAGARVAITAARQSTELEPVVAEAVEVGGQGAAMSIVADVIDPAACADVIQRTLGSYDRLDVLVNNAARDMLFIDDEFMTGNARFWNTDTNAWRLVVDTNINARS